MTTKQMQKIERMAMDSIKHAREAVKKSDELQIFLSLMEYKQGMKNRHLSVSTMFKKLKIS